VILQFMHTFFKINSLKLIENDDNLALKINILPNACINKVSKFTWI
jgi:hypothetical protein